MSTDVTPVTGLSGYVIEEILALMGRRRITKAEMARRLGASEVWIGRRLNGRLPIQLDDLQRIAAVLGVSASDLLPPRGTISRNPTAPIDPLGVRLVATVGDPNRQPHRPAVDRPQRAVRLPRPTAVAGHRPATRGGV